MSVPEPVDQMELKPTIFATLLLTPALKPSVPPVLNNWAPLVTRSWLPELPEPSVSENLLVQSEPVPFTTATVLLLVALSPMIAESLTRVPPLETMSRFPPPAKPSRSAPPLLHIEPAPVTSTELLKVPAAPPMFATPGLMSVPPLAIVSWLSGPRWPTSVLPAEPARKTELLPVTVT